MSTLSALAKRLRDWLPTGNGDELDPLIRQTADRLERIDKACGEFLAVKFPNYDQREAKLAGLILAITGTAGKGEGTET